MAEVKTGLESIIGKINPTGDHGLVYYNSLTGSAGTKNAGIGTKANDGSNAVYWGSALCFASGVGKVVSSGTLTVGSAGAETVCVEFYAGSDGVVAKATGGTAANVADAITARTGTAAGYCPLGYVTVGTSGSVIAGSIVDERVMGTATAISYITGFPNEETTGPIHVFDGSSYAHSKKQRFMGKLSVKRDFVVSTDDPWPSSGGSFMTVPRIAVEQDLKGIAGTTESVNLFLNVVKENESVDFPETEKSTAEYSAFYGSKVSW